MWFVLLYSVLDTTKTIKLDYSETNIGENQDPIKLRRLQPANITDQNSLQWFSAALDHRSIYTSIVGRCNKSYD